MADSLRWRDRGGGIDVYDRRPCFHHRRHRAPALFWRHLAQRSTGHLDSPASGAFDSWRWQPAQSTGFGMAADDRPVEAGGDDRRNGAAFDWASSAVDAE